MNNKNTPYSTMKIFHHYETLQKLKKEQRCAPIYIRIKPTNKCNHNCYYCHYRNPYLSLDEYNYEDYIAQDKMFEIIEDMKEIGVKAVTFSGGGEPLLYPYINEAMTKILENDIDLSIITNGSLLKNESAQILSKAKWVRISLDAIDDESYCQLRGIKKGSFQELCKNIKSFSEIKQPYCELGVNFVVGRDNYSKVYEVAKVMKSLGVNHVKYAPVISSNTEEYHAAFKEEVIEQINKLKVQLNDDTFKIIDLYSHDFDNYEVCKRTYNNCYIKEFVCIIGANSKIYYCHDKAYMENGLVGDLNRQSLKKVWFSDEVSKKFKEFDAVRECKHHCMYDERNLLINSFYDLDDNHINFI